MSKLERHTVLIEDDAMPLPKVFAPRQQSNAKTSLGEKLRENGKRKFPTPSAQPVAKRIPIKSLPYEQADAKEPVPVVSGSPWSHYQKRYTVKHWCLFAIGTSKISGMKLCMVRSLVAEKRQEKLDMMRRLCHPNIVQNMEFYISDDDGHFVISEMMESSLLHICRVPVYPSEPQLSSILYQTLSGLEYLISNGLVHENVSCKGVLVNTAGDVKISDIEMCRQGGDLKKLLDSFSRLTMMLMDKKKSREDPLGLSCLDQWSGQAVDMFTLMVSQPSWKRLAEHPFWKMRVKHELEWFVHYTSITAHYNKT
ncbi:kinase-like domain-containing protein [Fusarium mexicanum]|uniref:Kinase-like domain-containing protein n=1 Tax=Fusarium mexicanum TaxID=751941 RepID=A0A8H5I4M5_9HYPO|nr:kinase-like domain-containing protein [Fusarium mexicanum]